MGLEADIQFALDDPDLPGADQLLQWLDHDFPDLDGKTVLLRLVGEAESARLNQRYRHKSGPTNILSFPSDVPEWIDDPSIGDLVLCVPVARREAVEQHKALDHHLRHLLVHGVLHLLGHDHQTPEQAEDMEQREIEILARAGIANPYH